MPLYNAMKLAHMFLYFGDAGGLTLASAIVLGEIIDA